MVHIVREVGAELEMPYVSASALGLLFQNFFIQYLRKRRIKMLAKNVGMPPASFLEASAVEATVLRNWSEPACLPASLSNHPSLRWLGCLCRLQE